MLQQLGTALAWIAFVGMLLYCAWVVMDERPPGPPALS